MAAKRNPTQPCHGSCQTNQTKRIVLKVNQMPLFPKYVRFSMRCIFIVADTTTEQMRAKKIERKRQREKNKMHYNWPETDNVYSSNVILEVNIYSFAELSSADSLNSVKKSRHVTRCMSKWGNCNDCLLKRIASVCRKDLRI